MITLTELCYLVLVNQLCLFQLVILRNKYLFFVFFFINYDNNIGDSQVGHFYNQLPILLCEIFV